MRRWKASLILLLVIWFGPASAMGQGQDPDPESQLLRLSEAIERAKILAAYRKELKSLVLRYVRIDKKRNTRGIGTAKTGQLDMEVAERPLDPRNARMADPGFVNLETRAPNQSRKKH